MEGALERLDYQLNKFKCLWFLVLNYFLWVKILVIKFIQWQFFVLFCGPGKNNPNINLQFFALFLRIISLYFYKKNSIKKLKITYCSIRYV